MQATGFYPPFNQSDFTAEPKGYPSVLGLSRRAKVDQPVDPATLHNRARFEAMTTGRHRRRDLKTHELIRLTQLEFLLRISLKIR